MEVFFHDKEQCFTNHKGCVDFTVTLYFGMSFFTDSQKGGRIFFLVGIIYFKMALCHKFRKIYSQKKIFLSM